MEDEKDIKYITDVIKKASAYLLNNTDAIERIRIAERCIADGWNTNFEIDYDPNTYRYMVMNNYQNDSNKLVNVINRISNNKDLDDLISDLVFKKRYYVEVDFKNITDFEDKKSALINEINNYLKWKLEQFSADYCWSLYDLLVTEEYFGTNYINLEDIDNQISIENIALYELFDDSMDWERFDEDVFLFQSVYNKMNNQDKIISKLKGKGM